MIVITKSSDTRIEVINKAETVYDFTQTLFTITCKENFPCVTISCPTLLRASEKITFDRKHLPFLIQALTSLTKR